MKPAKNDETKTKKCDACGRKIVGEIVWAEVSVRSGGPVACCLLDGTTGVYCSVSCAVAE